MMQFFSQLMKLPVDVFVYSMEMFVQTMRGIQHIAYQGIDMMAEWDVRTPVEASSSESAIPEATYAVPEVMHAVPEAASRGHTATEQTTVYEEARRMPDKDLHDDMLKLVRYKVLFVKRDYEHAFPEHEELVAENTDASGYTAWKIAEFIQKLGDKTTIIPSKWKEYPADLDDNKQPKYRVRDTTGNPVLLGLPEDDKKYLRIYYEVLERYPRERFKYEERQIEVLEQIRDKIKPS